MWTLPEEEPREGDEPLESRRRTAGDGSGPRDEDFEPEDTFVPEDDEDGALPGACSLLPENCLKIRPMED